jgi:ureidoglycolate lyase
MGTFEVAIEPFSAEAYAPFGTPVSQPERKADGSEEFNAAWMLPTDIDGRPQWVYQRAFRQPLRVSVMERHHHVAQLLVPLTRKPFIMVAAPPSAAGKDVRPDPRTVRAFYLDGSFGLIINRGAWHALDRLPVDDGPLDFFFITEIETQSDMMAHAANHPERLERSDIVTLDKEIVLTDSNKLLSQARPG